MRRWLHILLLLLAVSAGAHAPERDGRSSRPAPPAGHALGPGPLAEANRYRYAGQEVHAQSGLIRCHFRYYEPNLQRWLNRDPIGLLGGVNLHAYVGNDPVNYSDPLGLWLGFSCELSQREWDKVNQAHGERIQDSRTGTDELDEALGRLGERTTVGSFTTRGQWLRAAEDATEVGKIAASGVALPELKGMQLVGLGLQARKLKALEDAAEAARVAKVAEELKEANVAQNAAKTCNAAKSGQNLLTFSPTVELGNAKYGLEHILRRHSFNNGAENVSKFSQGMGHIEIKGLINEAAQSGAGWQVQGGSRVLNANMGRVIGTDQAGNAVSGLRVVTDSSGRVITTYPIPAP
jgi:RHS repeat-associated protein